MTIRPAFTYTVIGIERMLDENYCFLKVAF